jgi:hypothetical protein
VASRRPIEIDLTEESGPRDPLARLERELARALLDEGSLTAAELEEARARQASAGGRLTTCLLELGLADDVRLRGLCGRLLRVPTALPGDVEAAAPALLARVERDAAVRFGVVPYARSGNALLVATSEPWRLPLLDSLAARAGIPIEPRFLDEAPLARLLGHLYGAPVAERFRAEPAPPRRGRSTPRPRLAAAADAPPPAELMSETGFAALYQSGRAAASTRAPSAWGRVRLDPARLRPLAPLDDARAALAAAGDAVQVGWLLARFALARAPRALLLAWEGGAWLGLVGAGPGVDARVAGALMVPAAPGSAFEAIAGSGEPRLGPLGSHPVEARFLALLGGCAPREPALFPAPCEGGPALALYADAGPGGSLGPGARELAAFAAAASAALERLAREARQPTAGASSRTPGSSAGR